MPVFPKATAAYSMAYAGGMNLMWGYVGPRVAGVKSADENSIWLDQFNTVFSTRRIVAQCP